MVVAIFLLTLFLRIYRLDTLTTLGGDQGQDFLVVRDMVLYHKWTLLGIKTSIAPFFQGPAYLYILYPFFLLFKLQPIAGAIAAVTMSALTSIALYITVRQFFSRQAALLSMLLYAVSPQFIMYGNTPLYQNFLPLFIVLVVYTYLQGSTKLRTVFLLGLCVGIGIELHRLTITLALSILIVLTFFQSFNWKVLGMYSSGLIVGISPTVLFEMRHQFLNTNLFLSYLRSQSAQVAQESVWEMWIRGAALFLGGNSMFAGTVILLLACALLVFMKKSLVNQRLRALFLVLGLMLATLSLKMSVLEPHYMLPLWVLLLITVPAWTLEIMPKKIGIRILVLLIFVNAYYSVQQLQNNHGYTMPDGWTLRSIQTAGKIIARDAQSHQSFNVASLLDGETRTHPLRYTTLLYGAQPGRVEEYPNNQYLYVVARPGIEALKKVSTWEIVSLAPFRVGAQWDLGDQIMLYRLDREEE